METVYIVIAILFLLPGLIGILLPVAPGIPYMFIVALIFAIINGFADLQPHEIGILGGIAVLSLIIDYAAGILGAKFGGASKEALIAGFLGLLIGTVVLPPIGGIFGLFAGIFLAETYRRRTKEEAIKAATGGVLGSVASIAINLILGLVFIGLFIWFAL
jgi:uncharacterized protein YqgC (DUF456 family)